MCIILAEYSGGTFHLCAAVDVPLSWVLFLCINMELQDEDSLSRAGLRNRLFGGCCCLMFFMGLSNLDHLVLAYRVCDSGLDAFDACIVPGLFQVTI